MAVTRAKRIWVGVGAFALVQAAGAAVDGPHLAPEARAQMAHGGEGGEGGAATAGHAMGGEGGEAGAVPAGPLSDLDYATNLHLMLGHLIVGEELVGMEAWNDALPHFEHPIEELYPTAAPELARRDAPPFGDQLDLLARRVKAKDKGPQFRDRLAGVRSGIEAALGAIDPAARSAAGFNARLIANILRTAASEYGDAFEEGKLVAVVEYQDSRGFVAEAGRVLAASEAALRGADPARLESLRGHLAELQKVYPTPLPPDAPVKDAGQVSAIVTQLEFDAGRFR